VFKYRIVELHTIHSFILTEREMNSQIIKNESKINEHNNNNKIKEPL